MTPHTPHMHECGHCNGLGYYCNAHCESCHEVSCIHVEEDDPCDVETCDHCTDGQIDWAFDAEDRSECDACKAENVPVMQSGDHEYVCEKCLRKWHDGWHPSCNEAKIEDGARNAPQTEDAK